MKPLLPQPPLGQNPDTHCFLLGREPLLSAAELAAVLNLKTYRCHPPTLVADVKIDDPQKLINELGSVIKIARWIGRYNRPADCAKFLNEYLPQGKINFSIGGETGARLGLAIKNELKKLNRNGRFVEIKNSASIIHNRLIESGADLNLYDDNIFLTEAIQPIAGWGERDYGRPRRDDLSGMLPPKLALTMINLARTDKNKILLDPFCGSGTILTEALLLGYTNLIGTDISEKAIADTQANIAWTNDKYKLKSYNLRLKTSDLSLKTIATDVYALSQQLGPKSVDTIITEPYLGHPLTGRETKAQLDKQAAELKQIYLESFKQFALVLKPGGIVVIVIPRFKFKTGWVTIDCRDEIKKAGFAFSPLLPDHDSLLYHRPNQWVGREIWRFVKS